MTGRGRGIRRPLPSGPVPHKSSIMAAFDKMKRGKVCPVCNIVVQIAQYKVHFDSCVIENDDTDIEVLQILTGEESRAAKAGIPIILDDDIKVEEKENADEADNENMNEQGDDNVMSNERSTRRSLRIQTTVTKEQIVKVEKETQVIEKDVPKNIKPVRRGIKRSSHGPNSTKMITKEHDTKRKGQKTKLPDEEEKTTRLNTSIRSESMEVTADSEDYQNVHLSTASTSMSIEPSTSRHVKQEEDDEVSITSVDVMRRIEVLLAMEATDSLDGNVSLVDEELDAAPSRTLILPYFVSFILKMINKVLTVYNEGFWEDDIKLIDKFINISNDARQLFMRLFLRKRTWLSAEKLKQRYTEIDKIDDCLKVLLHEGFLDDGISGITELEEAMKLLPLPNMRQIAKIYKLDATKGKVDLASSLISFAHSQKGLFGQTGIVVIKMLRRVKTEIGPCYRISERSSNLFKAIMTLYTPTEMSSSLSVDTPSLNIAQNVLFMMLQMDNGKLKMSAPNPSTSMIDIYEKKDDLYKYIDAKELEVNVMSLMSYNKLEESFFFAEIARDKLMKKSKTSLRKASKLSAPLRRFTTCWVLMRCVSHGASILEKQKQYDRAVEWQRYLLYTEELSCFCYDSRGVWYDRIALNLDSHLKLKDESLEEINKGMKDSLVSEKDKLMLQDRAIRLTKGDFIEQIVIGQPVKKEVYANRLTKSLGDSRVNHFIIRTSNGDEAQCSVEEIARRYYIEEEGFTRGIHAEGSIWHTVMGLIFYDIIFDPNIPNAWLSELQTNPVDLNTVDLYLSRKTEFDNRLAWLAESTDNEIEERIRNTWSIRHGEINSEVNWDIFESVDDCLDMLLCCSRTALCAVFRRVICNYRSCRSGFPDLTMWNSTTATVAVVEVKGPGDRLSTKQRLWLDTFNKLGIRAEVCHVVAKTDKHL